MLSTLAHAWGAAANRICVMAALLLALGLVPQAACGGEVASPGHSGDEIFLNDPDASPRVTTVWYGCNRNLVTQTPTRDPFGTRRGTSWERGQCAVSIPPSHSTGSLETASWWNWENPAEHIVLQSTTRMSAWSNAAGADSTSNPSEVARGDVGAATAGADRKASSRSLLVYIPGFNSSFESTARNTARLLVDTSFPGQAAFFSWPSRECVCAYDADEENLAWSRPHIAEFLTEIIRETQADRVCLMAHSMGARGLCQAIEDLQAAQSPALQSICEIVLTAPDLDADLFCQSLAPRLTDVARVTVYASQRDYALRLSTLLLKGYPRAGQVVADDARTRVTGVDTVDVSDLQCDWLAHSPHCGNVAIMADLRALLAHSQSPRERSLEPLLTHENCYRFCNP